MGPEHKRLEDREACAENQKANQKNMAEKNCGNKSVLGAMCTDHVRVVPLITVPASMCSVPPPLSAIHPTKKYVAFF